MRYIEAEFKEEGRGEGMRDRGFDEERETGIEGENDIGWGERGKYVCGMLAAVMKT